MIHPIYTYGENILRKTIEPLDFTDTALGYLISDMFETMRAANGVGLAANQIGVDKSIIVVEIELSDGELFHGAFINPKIIAYSGRNLLMNEGCLSFPGLSENVVRPETIDIEWFDHEQKYHRDFFHGVPSRILQHEVDHLNGILYVDKISGLDRLKIFRSLEDIKNKKVKTLFPIK